MREHAPDCQIAYGPCTCGRVAATEEQPRPMGAGIRDDIADLFGMPMVKPMEVDPRACVWDADDLWDGVPPEFHGAAISDGLKAMLNRRPHPPSFALVGPPGTGKTRSLWGMLHSMRKTRCANLIGYPVECLTVRDGEYASRREYEWEAIARTLAHRDRLRIESEAGHIRAHRYDRKALQELIDYPHWLAIDDIGAAAPNDWVSEALYHLANERRANNRTTVWTSNLTPQKIRDTFGGAIASRILGGAVIETSGSDRRIQ